MSRTIRIGRSLQRSLGQSVFGLIITTTILASASSQAQNFQAQNLPPVPNVPAFQSPKSPLPGTVTPFPSWSSPPPSTPAADPPMPAPGTRTVLRGEDLRQVVTLFINEALDVQQQAEAVNYNALYEQLLARLYGSPNRPQEVEYEMIRSLIKQYGGSSDRLLAPSEFNQLLNRPRPPVTARPLSSGVLYLKLDELTPATTQEIRQTLFSQDYSRGLVLDLRGSIGYDPQVVADVARLFLPPAIQPLGITEDRFGQTTTWNSTQLPIAANMPLVVLVDGNTRQGSVLLAAQLGINGQTTLLGQPTQGIERQTKFFILPSGAAIELAVARWKTGDQRLISQGLVPLKSMAGSDPEWLGAAQQSLQQPAAPPLNRPTVLVKEGQVGRFNLGLDLRDLESGGLGNVDAFSAASGRNVFQPNSDLKIFYVQDYILFGYRPQTSLRSYFANRIYTTAADALTGEGVKMGDTYDKVVSIYGKPGENGFNEVVPFPVGSRELLRGENYYINYDAIGLGLIMQSGTNRVVGIGLYKAGN